MKANGGIVLPSMVRSCSSRNRWRSNRGAIENHKHSQSSNRRCAGVAKHFSPADDHRAAESNVNRADVTGGSPTKLTRDIFGDGSDESTLGWR